MARWTCSRARFRARDPVIVAQALLGTQLVREHDDGVVTGLIVETEAYLAAHDPASHAYSQRRHCYRPTPRCAPMFGPQGTRMSIAVMVGTAVSTSSRKRRGCRVRCYSVRCSPRSGST